VVLQKRALVNNIEIMTKRLRLDSRRTIRRSTLIQRRTKTL
jgi:hypothetical protein